MLNAINKIHAILDQLNVQANIVDQQNKHSKSHKIIQENDIFSEKLFLTHSDLFQPYVDEVKNKTNELA